MFRSGTTSAAQILGRRASATAIDTLAKAATGDPLPEPLGLIQAVATTLTKERAGHKFVQHVSRVMDVAGILLADYRRRHPKPKKKDLTPAEKFVEEHGLVIPGIVKENLGGFVYAQLSRQSREVLTIDAVSEIVAVKYDLGSCDTYYLMPKDWLEERRDDPWDVRIPAGPYVKANQVDSWLSEFNNVLWKGREALQISYEKQMFGESIFHISDVSLEEDYVSDERTALDAKKMIARLSKFRAAGIRRRLLLHGPPGTGKTTLAQRVAVGLGNGRVLILQSSVIKDLELSIPILRFIAPDAVILDDIDRAQFDAQTLLKELQAFPKGMLFVATCNTTSKLDPALLRTGRFDEIMEVLEPSVEHRADIIDYFMKKFELSLSDSLRLRFLDRSEGFSPADIKEISSTLGVVCTASIDEDILDAEIDRIARQRVLYDKYEKSSSRSNSTIVSYTSDSPEE